MSGLLDALPRRRVPDAIVADLERLGPRVLTHADQERLSDAADILDAARRRAARWEDAARTRFERARRDGLEEGRAAAKVEAAAERIDLASRIEALRLKQEKALGTLLSDALRRFYGCAPWPDLMRAAVRHASAALPTEPRPVLAGAASDLCRLRAAAGTDAPWDAPLDLVADPAMRPGEVELRSADGIVRLSPDRHLRDLLRALGDPPGPCADDGAGHD